MSHLDMLGKPCPIPVIEAKKALRQARPGDLVTVLVDNDIARQNLEKMAKGMGHNFKFDNKEHGQILVTIEVADGCQLQDDNEGQGLVVAIGRQTMGGGSDELGRNLMKSFIYSLTELDAPPEHLLFFNGGVFLTTEGSTALDDLNALSEKGVVVNSCGACLNYFDLTEKVKVGGITNMYAIMSTMAQAKKLINL